MTHHISLREQFLSEVEGFLSAQAVEPTRFGKDAMSDPNFVFDLREGRVPSVETVDKVRAFIALRSKAQASPSPQREAVAQ